LQLSEKNRRLMAYFARAQIKRYGTVREPDGNGAIQTVSS